jgi:hypothetical protein
MGISWISPLTTIAALLGFSSKSPRIKSMQNLPIESSKPLS